MLNPRPANDSPSTFFALTFLLSVPFYVLNALANQSDVGVPELGAVYIALFTVTPILSASILTYRRRGSRGLKELIGRIFDYKRISKRRWYVPILLVWPFFFLLCLVGIQLLGISIPPALIPLVALPAAFPFFFVLAAAEEVGWMGYAFEPMQERGNALQAALGLGTIWAVWHVPFFVFIMPDPLVFTAQILTLVGTRVVMAWIFNNAGKSVFSAIMLHAVSNVALVTFPEIMAVNRWGSAMFCGLVIVTAFVVTLLWGPGTLAQYRFAGVRRPQESN